MRWLLKISIFIITFFVLITYFFQSVNAQNTQELQIKPQTINPGSFYYPFKRLWEKVLEKTQMSVGRRIEYSKTLLDKRLSELKYVAENKLLGEVQKSSERFAYQAGTLTEKIIQQNNKQEKESLIKRHKKYIQFLPTLRDQFPANSSYWLLIQQDIDYLSIQLQKLGTE